MRKKISALCLGAAFSLALTSCSNHLVANAGENLEILTIQDIKNYNTQTGRAVVVDFWHAFGNQLTAETNNVITMFERDMLEQHGIKISINGRSVGGDMNGLRAEINRGAATRRLPTLTAGMPGHFIDNMQLGIHLPLDGFADDETFGLIGDYAYDDFIDILWNESRISYGNHQDVLVGLPFAKSTEVMYYNSDFIIPLIKSYLENSDTPQFNEIKTTLNLTGVTLFTDENIKFTETLRDNDDDVYRWANATWSQAWFISEYVIRNRQRLINEGTLSSGFTSPMYIDSQSNFALTGMYQWSGSPVLDVNPETGQGIFRMDTPQNEASMNYFYSHFDANRFSMIFGQGFASDRFATRQTVMTIGSSAGGDRLLSEHFVTGVTNRPQQPNQIVGNEMAVLQGPNITMLHPNSNNLTRLAGWLFMRYISSTEVSAEWAENTGYIPVRQSSLEDPYFEDFIIDLHRDAVVNRILLASTEQKDNFRSEAVFPSVPGVRALIEPFFVTHMFNLNENFGQAVTRINREVDSRFRAIYFVGRS